ncbi:hypothetical protein [Iodobacter fluviatilis]|uniref:hypothetical protein n=1 Tax=Iodobacter fluviatilis TaxID=537 RepID=UPI00155A0452|nr:hypothetical protein [Iodobacter fluviatilis]
MSVNSAYWRTLSWQAISMAMGVSNVIDSAENSDIMLLLLFPTNLVGFYAEI